MKTKSIVLGLASVAAVLATSFTVTQKPAQASSLNDAVDFLNNNWGQIVSNAWSPWNKQVFMTNLSPQETRDVQNQYRSRADGVLTDRCINKVADMYWRGWRNTAAKTSHRWMFAMRVENSQANCYQRFTNQNADAFIRARGW
ncbi:hypothetical protein [Nostoc sp.]|uniref:hypothetical protein n=1 Tax=Nostoc sp. TaxID=1180 RepID=UPI002FF4F5BE